MKAGLRPRLVIALLVTLLAACAGTGGNPPADDLRNSTDQSDLQRRAQIRLQLAVGYYGQGQLATALDEIKQALQIDPETGLRPGFDLVPDIDRGGRILANEHDAESRRPARLARESLDVGQNGKDRVGT